MRRHVVTMGQHSFTRGSRRDALVWRRLASPNRPPRPARVVTWWSQIVLCLAVTAPPAIAGGGLRFKVSRMKGDQQALALNLPAELRGADGSVVAGQVGTVPDQPATTHPVFKPKMFVCGVWMGGSSRRAGLSYQAWLNQAFADIAAHGANAVHYAGGADPQTVLNCAARHGLKVVLDLPSRLEHTIMQAQPMMGEKQLLTQLQPLVKSIRHNPALLSYYIADEPGMNRTLSKRLLAVQQALRQLDPKHPATECLVGLNRIKLYTSELRPPLLVIDVYPLLPKAGPGQFQNMWFIKDLNMMQYMDKAMAYVRQRAAPTWVILQAHSFAHWLRLPTPTEMRLQTWLALTRAVKGVYFFGYRTEHGWVGLINAKGHKTPRWDELGQIYHELAPLGSLLLSLHQAKPIATVTGGGNPYYRHGEIATLGNGQNKYVIVVNRSVTQAQPLVIHFTAGIWPHALLNRCTGKHVPVSNGVAKVTLAAGDGAILEVEP